MGSWLFICTEILKNIGFGVFGIFEIVGSGFFWGGIMECWGFDVFGIFESMGYDGYF